MHGLAPLTSGVALELAPALASSLQGLRSLAAAVSSDTLALGAAPDAPVLVRLPQRPWGPAAELQASTIKGLVGGRQPARVSVLRDAFTSFDQKGRPLSSLLKHLGHGSFAVSAELAQSHSRALVDEYRLDAASGQYKLASPANDLLRYLRAQGVTACIVPDVNSPSMQSATAVVGATKGVRQSSNEVLMVAPTAFGFNEQAAQDNSFMHKAQKPGEGTSLTRAVLREFAGLHHQLTEVAGVKVVLCEHDLAHGTPDACFPNNWFSTHPAGEAAGGVQQSTLVLYPMKCPNRVAERRPDIIGVLKARGYAATYDMAPAERDQKYFEGTGVLVLDRINGVVYVDISERADAALAQEWTQRMGYKKLVTFRSSDLRGAGVYHTNVMMAVGTGVAIVCGASVKDDRERSNLMSSLRSTHEVVDISLAQMDALCGNALELTDGRGLPVMAMSTQAYTAFTPDQRKVILRHCADIVHSPIDTLERVGGGGVRCTLAELF